MKKGHINYKDYCDVDFLLGKTLTNIEKSEDAIQFTLDSGEVYEMSHKQDCCESVSIEDINGDLSDLIGSPITLANERTSNDPREGQDLKYADSFTWTFYSLATVKGYVDIRWYGESNGFYSEGVSFGLLTVK